MITKHTHSLVCILLVLTSCSLFNTTDIIINNRSTEYSYNGGLGGGTLVFYPDSSYHFYGWSDDMSTCIDSGSFWLNNDTVHFKSIYNIEKRSFYYDNDTCIKSNLVYYLDNGKLYRFDFTKHTINSRFPYVRTDIIQQERERDSIRRANDHKHIPKRVVPRIQDTSTVNKK